MSRLAVATLVVTIARLSHAEPHAAPAAKPAKPDEVADVEGREANLESREPRKGITLALALGGGIMLGGDIGVGRGPAVSLRLGHVATRKTIITFEVAGTSGLHKRSVDGATLTDSNLAVLAGAQRYTSSSFWVRTAGGFTALVTNAMTDGTGGDKQRIGVGGLVGGGLDLARWGYLVVDLEGFGIASVSGDGFKTQLAFSLGLSYY